MQSVPARSRGAHSGAWYVGRPGGVLVVGGGFVGSHVAAAFVARGVPTTVLTRGPLDEELAARIHGARVVAGDAGDGYVLDQGLEAVDHVVWCAGGVLPADSDARTVNDLTASLPPLLALLDRVAARDGTSVSFLSSGGAVYGNATVLPVPERHALRPISAHGVTKVAAELYLGLYRQVHGLRTLALRLGNVYGPGQRPHRSQGVVATALACAAAHRPLPIFGDGSSVRDYVYIDDVVDVVCRLTARADVPEVVNVGTGEGTTTRELVELVSRVTGRSLAVEHQPARPGDVDANVLDTALLTSLLAYEPVSIEPGLALTWEAIQGGRAAAISR